MIAIRIQALTKKYPKPKRYRDIFLHPFGMEYVQALNGVSLDVERRTMLGLLGPNGAGKTSLIKILATLVTPTSGTVVVNGHDIGRDSRDVRRVVGFVTADERSFYWRLTGRQNLAFFSVLDDIPADGCAARVDAVLDQTGLLGVGDVMFKDYSTGMKQRLAIARGLLCEPDILLLDEPTRSLDPFAAQKLRTFITRDIIGKLGATAIIATHNLHEAHDMCSHVAVMKHGDLIARGETGEVFRNTRANSYHVTISRTSPDIPFGELGVISAHRALDAPNRSFLIMTDDIETALREMFEAGVALVGCSEQQMSLDDFFISLITDSGE